MADSISGLGSVVGELLGGGDSAGGAGGILGDVLGGGGGALGSLLGGAGDIDPESMIVDAVGKMLGLNSTDLGIAKAALGAVTGDPLAIASGVAEGIGGLASGQSPFGASADDAPKPA